MTTVTAIPKVKSGYKQLDYTKDYGYSYNNAISCNNLVEGDSVVPYSDDEYAIVSSSDIVDMWYLPLDTPLTVTLDSYGVLTCYNGGSTTQLAITIEGYRCSAIFDYGTPCIAISCSNGGYLCYGYSIVAVADMPQLDSMTYHYGRLWGVCDGRLSYCQSLDVTNWSQSLYEGGYIDLPSSIGSCHTIISRQQYLYIMGDGGMAKLYAKTDPLQFSLTIMTANVYPVCRGTAVLCGDNIWWLSSNGNIYQLDSTDVETMITLDDDNSYNYSSASSSGYWQGKYVVPIGVSYPDHRRIGCEKGQYTTNSLLVVDTLHNSYQLLRGVDCSRVTATNRLALCVRGSSVPYMLGSCNSSSYWQSQLLTLSGHDHKRIDSISVDTDSPVTVVVSSGKQSRQYYVDSGLHRVRVSLRGGQFRVGLAHSGSSMNVAPLGVYYTAFGTDKTGG